MPDTAQSSDGMAYSYPVTDNFSAREGIRRRLQESGGCSMLDDTFAAIKVGRSKYVNGQNARDRRATAIPRPDGGARGVSGRLRLEDHHRRTFHRFRDDARIHLPGAGRRPDHGTGSRMDYHHPVHRGGTTVTDHPHQAGSVCALLHRRWPDSDDRRFGAFWWAVCRAHLELVFARRGPRRPGRASPQLGHAADGIGSDP